MSSNCNEAFDLERGEEALDDEVTVGLAMYISSRSHIVQIVMTVAAENEEALIEWLIVTRVWMNSTTTLRLTLISLMSE